MSVVVVVIIAVFLLQDQSMKAHDLKRLEKMQTESKKECIVDCTEVVPDRWTER